jgi:ribosomal subunit interface protein
VKVPLKITFRHMAPSDALEARVRERADKLDRLNQDIIGGRIVVDMPQRRRRKGKIFQVQVDITVPGSELVVSRDHLLNHAHADIYAAIEGAFDAMERRLVERSREMQGEVKRDLKPERGIVNALFREEGYGFIVTRDSREVYFHKNSVLGDAFDRLRPGAEVRFSEEEGEKGPQASTVQSLT